MKIAEGLLHGIARCLAAGRSGDRLRVVAWPQPGEGRFFVQVVTLLSRDPSVHRRQRDRADGGQGMTIQARIQNPAQLIPGVTQPVLALLKATREGGVPESTLELVHLRASQINGCSYCVDAGVRSARKGGESDDRLFAV